MKASIKIIEWSARVLCILVILFISMFALDAFNPEKTTWQQITDFLYRSRPFVCISYRFSTLHGKENVLVGYY